MILVDGPHAPGGRGTRALASVSPALGFRTGLLTTILSMGIPVQPLDACLGVERAVVDVASLLDPAGADESDRAEHGVSTVAAIIEGLLKSHPEQWAQLDGGEQSAHDARAPPPYVKPFSGPPRPSPLSPPTLPPPPLHLPPPFRSPLHRPCRFLRRRAYIAVQLTGPKNRRLIAAGAGADLEEDHSGSVARVLRQQQVSSAQPASSVLRSVVGGRRPPNSPAP